MSDLNTQPTPVARQPRGAVLVNDVLVPWESFEVTNNTTFDADEFRVWLPLSSLPAELPVDTLASGKSLRVQVRAGIGADKSVAQLQHLITGRADDVSVDYARGMVELSGRDFTGLFIDRKTTEKFANMTAGAIARVLAARVGLLPVVKDTAKLVGSYYAIDHALMTREVSEWDLLTWLARQEGFAVYVSGSELHFEPKPSEKGAPYVLQWTPPADGAPSFTGMDLRLSRNLTVARDVTVTVRSWSAKGKKVVEATYPKGKHKGAAAGTSGASQPDGYVRNIPGLTHEQAIQRAQAIHAEITAHEMKLDVTLPADELLTTTVPVSLRGTGTAFDQIYYPESITRRMSMTDGYLMTLRAKNRSPDNEVTL